jgi:hypothetical protein
LRLIQKLGNRGGARHHARITGGQCLLDIASKGEVGSLAMAGKLGL